MSVAQYLENLGLFTMDELTFFSKLIEHLAWPVASVALVILLKDEIVKAAPFVKRLKAGPVEAEFEREVKQLEKATAKQPGKADATNLELDSFLLQLAELHPRSAILEAWVRLEAAARAALPHANSKSAGPGYIPAARLPEALVGAKVIDQGQVTLYHELRRLRNEVAHLVGLEPTVESVRSYIDLARQLQSQIMQKPSIS